jgi:hypothetical protein
MKHLRIGCAFFAPVPHCANSLAKAGDIGAERVTKSKSSQMQPMPSTGSRSET